MTATRMPPYSEEAESALLGAMMLWADTVGTVHVRTSDFYVERHRLVHEAILGLFARGAPTEPAAVIDELRRRDQLARVGGHLVVQGLVDSCPNPASAPHYAKTVADDGLVRRVQAACYEAAERGFSVEDARVYANATEAGVFAAVRPEQSREGRAMSDIMGPVLERLEAAGRGEASALGMPTGLVDVDQLIGGLHPGNLVVIGALTSVGKTTLVCQIAAHVAREVSVLVYSLEMPGEDLVSRLLCARARVSWDRVKNDRLAAADWTRVTIAAEQLEALPLTFFDQAAMTPMQIRADARRYKPGMIVVDYLQRMDADGKHENRNQEIASISRSLKEIAMEHRIPVLAASQLNRNPANANRPPTLSDLRESGAIEQDSDVVVLLHKGPGVVQADVAKHRNGPTGKVNLRFVADYTLFEAAAAAGGSTA